LDVVSASKSFGDSIKSGGTTAPCANGDPLISGDCGVTVSATCPNGEWAISGGYSITGGGYITSDYPSSSSSWTVTLHNEGNGGVGSPVTLMVTADCLKANFGTTTQIVTSTATVPADANLYTETASCPSATTLTGGGYRSSNGAGSSKLYGNGWSAQLSVQLSSSANPKTYAVCSTAHLMTASTLSSAAKLLNPGDSATVSADCPSGALLVGGGFQLDGVGGLSGEGVNSAGTGWQLKATGPSGAVGPGTTGTFTVYDVCVTVA
jgi:hypothetical protein